MGFLPEVFFVFIDWVFGLVVHPEVHGCWDFGGFGYASVDAVSFVAAEGILFFGLVVVVAVFIYVCEFAEYF